MIKPMRKSRLLKMELFIVWLKLNIFTTFEKKNQTLFSHLRRKGQSLSPRLTGWRSRGLKAQTKMDYGSCRCCVWMVSVWHTQLCLPFAEWCLLPLDIWGGITGVMDRYAAKTKWLGTIRHGAWHIPVTRLTSRATSFSDLSARLLWRQKTWWHQDERQAKRGRNGTENWREIKWIDKDGASEEKK